ncbi:hypothetical protein BDL97_16G050900 [Sphagnum fallax]|nr:hypothetical protein BDL97_16G050900 [Sphagnum fallax]KAH8937849.1 hypothetical protein BDL97_16G050900 [Sphagnum fallax]
MDQAQHTRATPDECRLDVNDTILAEAEESSAEAAAGAEIPQAANSQDGAQARVGEEGALGAFDGISLVSPKRGFAGSSSQRAKTTNAEVGHDVEKGEGEMTDGERLIRPLLAIRGLEATQINMCKVALEEWQNTAELFVKRVDKKNKEARSIRNEIYQVVGFYSAFQGLLITAVAQSNLLQCHNVGFPLALSAIATAAAVIGMGQKNAAIRDLKMTIKSETPTRKAFVARVEDLKRQGTDFNFRNIKGRMVKKSKLRKNKCRNIWAVLFSYETWIIITLIAFGGLCMAAMRQILCDPGRSYLST